MKKVLIFGSTGSIGKNALSVIKKDKKKFNVLGLCANKDTKTLYSQIKEFNPSYVCMRDEISAKKLAKKLRGRVKLFNGQEGLGEFSKLSSDISIMAISGISCLKPLFINIKYTKRIALANKESIVTAGSLVFKEAKKFNTQILPVDSEINALFQLINGKNGCVNNNFRRVYLTASGGALADYKNKVLTNISVKEVLVHPTWKMGKRITVDSATLVNKAFEVIEAHHFFGLELERIGIIMHKESNVHALGEFRDNTVFACLYPPDMKMPISFSLYYPNRSNSCCESNFSSNHGNAEKSFSYSFKPICYKEYPLLKMLLDAAKRKDNSLVILNACDEVAINYFLKKKIKFTGIHKAMKYIYKFYPRHKIKNIDDILFWDDWARIKTKQYLEKQ